MASRRVLYAGDDITSPGLLRDGLYWGFDCSVVRSPVATARSLAHREATPVILVKKSGSLAGLLRVIRRRLDSVVVAPAWLAHYRLAECCFC